MRIRIRILDLPRKEMVPDPYQFFGWYFVSWIRILIQEVKLLWIKRIRTRILSTGFQFWFWTQSIIERGSVHWVQQASWTKLYKKVIFPVLPFFYFDIFVSILGENCYLSLDNFKDNLTFLGDSVAIPEPFFTSVNFSHKQKTYNFGIIRSEK